MSEIGRITINQVDIVEVDADPTLDGVDAPTGSFAILNSPTVSIYGSWQKIGPLITDWAKLNPNQKSGYVVPGAFSGNPKKADVSFQRPFPSTNYVIHINGSNDVRSWTFENVGLSGFTINSNANASITGIVSWSAELVEETS